MNKLIMVLALLLAPFFSLNSFAISDSVSPKTNQECQIESVNGALQSHLFVGDSCSIDATQICQAIYPDTDRTQQSSATWYHTNTTGQVNSTSEDSGNVVCEYTRHTFRNGTWSEAQNEFNVGSYTGTQTDTKTCAPDAHPEYIYGVDSDDDGQPDACYIDNPALEQCPQGNYKYKLAGGCVPIDCGGSGQQKTMWASGDIYTNTTGTYCSGDCAFSVAGGQNPDNYTGNIGITGVSTGDICGQGGLEDRWFNEGVGEDCVSENGFISCPNGDTPDAPTENTPTIDLDSETFQLEEITPLIPNEEVCVDGDASCEVRNLKETLVTKGLEQNEIDKILHNKKIAADEKTTNKIVDGINESIGRNAQGLQMVTAAIDGLKGSIGTGGANSNGDGFGDGDVTCDGDDCQGEVLTDIIPSEGLESFWESEYEDGIEGMFSEKIEEYKTTEFYLFLDQFKPQISGGSAPNYNWCFNFGLYMNFGCSSLSIDPRVFPALKMFILISTAFACRVILFGG